MTPPLAGRICQLYQEWKPLHYTQAHQELKRMMNPAVAATDARDFVRVEQTLAQIRANSRFFQG